MTITTRSIQTQLNLLREEYAAQIPQKIEMIEKTWSAVAPASRCDETIRSIHHMVHSIAGSGTTFGFPTLSTAARTLETTLYNILEHARPLSAEQQRQITILLEALRHAAAISNPDEHTFIVDELSLAVKALENEQDNRLIFLVEDDLDLANDLALQIKHFGYTVCIFSRLADFKEAIRKTRPAAIVMDIIFPEGSMAGVDIIANVHGEVSSPIPVLFISARGDLTARLQAVRAGGRLYMTKPLNIGGLIDALDTLSGRYRPTPYRILIVEDDEVLAHYYVTVLEQAGMVTEVITDPLQIMQPLIDFRPDLLLMDVYMPGCSGLELASVIRQQEEFVGIPIVFLSAESDLEQQMAAMKRGGDDFLTKPIQPDHLVSAVTSRVQRSRVLRSFMTRDGLTGLLNHSATKAALEREIDLANRYGRNLAFVMIDIDHFKTINDTYGHSAGDHVLRVLSRLLQRRLRRTDIIGRYGGEEFAVILTNTDMLAACRVIDQIREDFAYIRQGTANAAFTVTFSCGIAGFPQFADAHAINDAADKALYKAKHAGRNRIMLAD